MSLYENLTDVEIFEQFVDQKIIDSLVEQSTKYALFLNNPDSKISPKEMKCVIAIMILSAYHDMYWSSEKDLNVLVVSDAMLRDRFRQIVKYLECADNTKPNNNDKMLFTTSYG
ncbi:hypothetical protein NQ314_013082 [Rhamnusium bicolor]|uniref:PiggyBac transposable element-derived protein domain-containing protein n=1 Tax=Rhamnusium bicolor TaxID=1586634 RepID=A0AAV8X903_9CUCU|nr:hypothetical protein NQ314_013082 [Rhamnusium bicolor]